MRAEACTSARPRLLSLASLNRSVFIFVTEQIRDSR